jgi:outer membrane protein OmpA-like peptidoglycan-associated protein
MQYYHFINPLKDKVNEKSIRNVPLKTTILNNMKTKTIMITFALCIALVFSGCKASRTLKGGAIGSGAGAAIGGIIGSRSDNTAKGAIIGAAVGGTAGAVIGKYMDKQAAELEKELENAKVERVGEGIQITMESGILFEVDSHALKPVAQDELKSMANVLKNYPDTKIKVDGHTDSTGSEKYNQTLSERRAQSVSNYLRSLGVTADRITEMGFGESIPVADNSTADGRRLNRRVEIGIMADENLKEAAEKGDL